METAQQELLGELIELWPTAAWLAAGATSAKQWLLAYTNLSYREAQRLERIAELSARHPNLADAVVSGSLSLRRAEILARAVTSERAPKLTDEFIDTFLELAASTADDEAVDVAVRFWADQVDQELAPTRVQLHSLTLSPNLFGGGQIHGSLAPVPFANVKTAVDAWTQDPDPADAPYKRTLSERRADALDDLCDFALTHDPDTVDDNTEDDGIDWDDLRAGDTYDGSYPGDDLDQALDALANDGDAPDEADDGEGGLDPMVLLRRRLRRAEKHRRRRIRRRVRAKSGVLTNVHIDLRTLANLRDIDDIHDLVLRGEGWHITRTAAQQLLCDSQMVATLFDGKTKILDANEAAEQFSRSQRRALAARDGHCVFPSCTRPPRHCDAHHLHPRHDDGPTVTENGALLCRFHHRLIHQLGWNLLVDDTGHWTAVDPHGTHWTGRPTTVPPTTPAAGASAKRRTPDQDAD